MQHPSKPYVKNAINEKAVKQKSRRYLVYEMNEWETLGSGDNEVQYKKWELYNLPW